MSRVRSYAKSRWPFSISIYPAAMLLLLAAAPSAAQMDISSISISSGPAYSSGTFTDFFIEPELTGSGIASVRLTRQSGGFIDLVEDTPGTWICPFVPAGGACDFFPTLQDIRDLGNLTFTVTGTLTESDVITIPFADWDPGLGQTGFPVITSPSSGQTGVSLTPTFTWNAAPAWVDVVFAEVRVASSGDEVDSAQLGGTDTSWGPSLLSEGLIHEFGLSFFEVFFFEVGRTSPDPAMDDYLFSSGFQAFNFVPFSTAGAVPALGGVGTAALLVGLIGFGRAALGSRRRS